MNYKVIEPEGVLREYVQSFWILSMEKNSTPTFEFQTFADCSTGIIIQHANGRSGVAKDGMPIPKVFLYGQSTKPTWSIGSNGLFAAGVVLLPQAAYELFGIEMRFLTDQMISLEDISRDTRLLEIFDRPESAIKILSDYLIELIRKIRIRSNPTVTGCLSIIHSQKGLVSIRKLSADFNVSERQLERVFARNIGTPPRLYSQIKRFEHAVRLLRTTHAVTLTDITYDLGFADQSHFNRVVKKFSGMSPGALKQYLSRNVANAVLIKGSENAVSKEIQTYFE